MPRYIDADALKEECFKFANDVSRSTMAFVQGQINAAPTANVAPIADTVRKMQERLHEKTFELNDANEDIFLAVEVADIDQIAKEMLEGADG